MKVIISHDVDHLTLREHLFKDFIVQKHFIRTYLELFKGKITISEFLLRHSDLWVNKWNNVVEIIEFNKINNIKSCFFFGMSNGLGLNYDYKKTKNLIKAAINNNFEVGVHGIEFDNFSEMQNEFEKFKLISGLHNFGIRFHYLRSNNKTLSSLAKIGYSFDSTRIDFSKVYIQSGITEFPLHLMDSWIMYGDRKFQNCNLDQAKSKTIKFIDDAVKNKIDYFSILFHDFYFSNRFETWKEWYIWLIAYLKSNNFKFITYKEAIEEIAEINKLN
jgi:hypothetical protein